MGTTQENQVPALSLIVPTYNEAENLPELVRRVRSAMRGYSYEVIVVDDDSPDGTAEVAEALSHECPIKVVVRKAERGLASAVVTGFRHSAAPVLGVMDADLQHPPEQLPLLMEEIYSGADLVVASRYSPGGGTVGWSIGRIFISRAATYLGRSVLSAARRTPDPLSGFFLLRREVIDGVELRPSGYKILLEVLTRGRANRVASVPYVFHKRSKGRSKLGVREQANYLFQLMSLVAVEKRGLRSPRR